jgi:hypothetical protein
MRKLMFGKQAVLLYAVAALLAMTVDAHADTILGFTIASTGVQGTHGAIPGFYTDANYLYYSTATDPSINPGVLQNGQNGATPAYIMSTNAWPISGGPWDKNTGTGKWIGPIPQYTQGFLTAPANTYYVYQTTFTIPTNVNLSTVLITGTLASDNCDTAIGINGVGLGGSVMGSNCATAGNSFSTGHQFEIGGSNSSPGSTTGIYFAYSAFHTGINTIQFVVYNDGTETPNPTGLVVWNMSGQVEELPEPSTAGLVIAGIGAVAWLRRRSFYPSA